MDGLRIERNAQTGLEVSLWRSSASATSATGGEGRIDSKSEPTSYLINVQHCRERDAPYRALQHVCAEIAGQSGGDRFQPVHTLGSCDYDFEFSRLNTRLSPVSGSWREKRVFRGDVTRCITTMCLQPMQDVLARLPGALGNESIHAALSHKFGFSLVMLPHVPLLRDLTMDTHPLIRWASLIAHATPYNGHEVPKEVREASPAVEAVLAMLSEKSRLADDEAREAAVNAAWDEGWEKEWEEGREEGRREGLAAVGISSKADFQRAFPSQPVPEWLD